MKHFAVLLLLIFTSMTFMAADAEAKRFGGGSSIGRQRTLNAPLQRAPAAAPAPASPAPLAAPQPTGNRWLGPLAGLALGAGLGALFASSGMVGGMGALAVILLVVMGAMSLLVLFARKQQPTLEYAGAGAPVGAGVPTPVETPADRAAPPGIAADFPREAFLRSVKTSFIRLQAANDRKDLDDIREYATPQVYAEVAMQIQERGDAPQKTDVASIEAELLEIVNDGAFMIASVRLTGQLSENGATAEAFDEIWHMQKDTGKPGAIWLLGGIQQI